MKHWETYTSHEPDFEFVLNEKTDKIEKHDGTIYTLDIETTSYFVDKSGTVHPSSEYLEYHSDKKSEDRIDYVGCCMYIWMFGVNDDVYYGRTKEELIAFMSRLPDSEKIVWIHNLSFEFEFLQDVLKFDRVFARKSHKPMWTRSKTFPNIEFRCSLMLSNCKLEDLPENFGFDIHKKTGDLDYDLIRTCITPLTKLELDYCEYDCLVLYEYIKTERNEYKSLVSIPHTSTGKVRRELHSVVDSDFEYRSILRKAIDVLPSSYNSLMDAYAGGYTHANRNLSGDLYHDIVSYDFTSSYPYVLISERYPMRKFANVMGKITVDDVMNNKDNYAYLLHIRIDNIKCITENTFISVSKCIAFKGAATDNGRIVSAEYVEMMITETDLEYILQSYSGKYNIIEAKYSRKEYLPKVLIEFILKYYVMKTEYKNVKGKENIYSRIKSLFNSIYGMCVTNDVCDMMDYKDGIWKTIPCNTTKKLSKKEKAGFLSPAWGVWCCAYARRNLLLNVIKNDSYTIYCDTDSIKLLPGFDKQSIIDYNKSVEKKLHAVADFYGIDFYKFAPSDCDGIPHMIGLFDPDGEYSEFITLGAKKYAYRDKKSGKLTITISGVPKEAVVALNDNIENFEDGLIFGPEHMNKLTHFYVSDLPEIELTDYLGNKTMVNDRCGVCLVPSTYVLGQSSIRYTGTATERTFIDV